MDEITYVTPEMYGYKDRGMLKWQGMILAAQTDAINEIKKEPTEYAAKEEMNELEISQVLNKAYAMSLPIAIQANAIRNGSYYKDVECKVIGCEGGKIHLRVIDGRETSCTIDQIRNVEFMDPLHWHEKRQ